MSEVATRVNMVAATIVALIAMAITVIGAVFYDILFNYPIDVKQIAIMGGFGFLGGFLAYSGLHLAHMARASRTARY